MRILNYIGEFFLFRWLFGKLFHKRDNNGSFVSSNKSIVEDNSVDGSSIDHYSQGYSAHNYLKDSQHDFRSFNDFHEEQDDYDMFDDF